jgi:putative hemolysin
MKKVLNLIIILLVLSLMACAPAMNELEPTTEPEMDQQNDGEEIVDEGKQVEETEEDVVGIANPASTYCEEQGGVLELRTDEEGNVTGYCVFEDGSECEEWAFFNGECLPESEAMLQSPPEKATIGNAFVDNRELVLEEGLSVHISGNLPDPCHSLYIEIAKPDENNNIYITTSSWYLDTGLSCIQVLEPFDVVIEVPTEGLADGVYTVYVNGEEVGAFQSTNE